MASLDTLLRAVAKRQVRLVATRGDVGVTGLGRGLMRSPSGWLAAHDLLHHWPGESFTLVPEIRSFGAEIWCETGSSERRQSTSDLVHLITEDLRRWVRRNRVDILTEHLQRELAIDALLVDVGFNQAACEQMVQDARDRVSHLTERLGPGIDDETPFTTNGNPALQAVLGRCGPEIARQLQVSRSVLAGAIRASWRQSDPAVMRECFGKIREVADVMAETSRRTGKGMRRRLEIDERSASVVVLKG